MAENLVEEMPKQQNYQLYMNNWFSEVSSQLLRSVPIVSAVVLSKQKKISRNKVVAPLTTALTKTVAYNSDAAILFRIHH